MDEQHVHPVGAIRQGAGSLNINKQLAAAPEILAREARVAHLLCVQREDERLPVRALVRIEELLEGDAEGGQ